ncbi:nucleoside-diphosphate-sugar epimerase [Mycobacterium sp. URHB0021]|jgi:dihydroflavonol-4-reductase
MVLRYASKKGLPAVAMCVSTTYGPRDFLPTRHGGMVAAAVRGKLPFSIKGYNGEAVGIEDAACVRYEPDLGWFGDSSARCIRIDTYR